VRSSQRSRHGGRFLHIVEQQRNGLRIEQRRGDPPCRLPRRAFGRQQPVAQCGPQAPLLLHALAIITRVADEHMLDLVRIVDQHHASQAADLQDRRLISFLGEGRDGICPQRPDRLEQPQPLRMWPRRGRSRPGRRSRCDRRNGVMLDKGQRGHDDPPISALRRLRRRCS